MTDTTTLRADLAAMERRAQNAELALHDQTVMSIKLHREREESIAELRAAESALASLRGEAVVLRGLVELGLSVYRGLMAGGGYSEKWFEQRDRFAREAEKALTATPRAAALGALVAAALRYIKELNAYEAAGYETLRQIFPMSTGLDLPAETVLVEAEDALQAAADAVLAAMGKEGANNATTS